MRVLVLNALWFGDPHPTHFNVEEALAVAEEIGAERTYLTHLTHRVGQPRNLPNALSQQVQAFGRKGEPIDLGGREAVVFCSRKIALIGRQKRIASRHQPVGEIHQRLVFDRRRCGRECKRRGAGALGE